MQILLTATRPIRSTRDGATLEVSPGEFIAVDVTAGRACSVVVGREYIDMEAHSLLPLLADAISSGLEPIEVDGLSPRVIQLVLEDAAGLAPSRITRQHRTGGARLRLLR